MINFQKVSYKNFLSTGNVPNVIELNKHSATLITGKNGYGKSSILCAITYALFGKPFRNINKPQLINSINQKNMLVEIDFEIGGTSYTVRRGMKPNVFQIIRDGKLLNEESDNRDYQKILEQQILKLNYKTFTQVVILGSATFVPFMQLPAQKRREIIEDILDIKVFSTMNSILKEKYSKLKGELGDIDINITTTKTKIDAQKKLIDTIQESKDTLRNSVQTKIDENNDAIQKSRKIIEEYSIKNEKILEKRSKYVDVSKNIQQAEKMMVKFNTILSTYQKDVEFFDNNDVCPRCDQNIQSEHKNHVLVDINQNVQDYQTKLNQVSKAHEKLSKQLETLKSIDKEISSNNMIIAEHNNIITMLNNSNIKLNNELNTTISGDMTEETETLNDLTQHYSKLSESKTTMMETKQVYDVASTLLKDTGIKTAIIHEYIPVINKLINKYLNSMDFYAQFELDDTFQEVIRSRNRDIFSYNSFSEGEKQRISLSIMLTWRHIAKMKNSANTNLLIMDEIFDSSMDTDGVDLLSDMLKELTGTNVFVISHRDISNSDVFDHTIRFKKQNDFSIIA